MTRESHSVSAGMFPWSTRDRRQVRQGNFEEPPAYAAGAADKCLATQHWLALGSCFTADLPGGSSSSFADGLAFCLGEGGFLAAPYTIDALNGFNSSSVTREKR